MPSTFTPPTIAGTPAVLPETRGVQYLLFRHVPPMQRGLNIWKMPDGTYLLDQQPQLLSNPDPANHTDDANTPVFTYYGGHVYQVSDTEAAALTTAGYGAYLSAALPDPNPGNPAFGAVPAFYGGSSAPAPRTGTYSSTYTSDYP